MSAEPLMPNATVSVSADQLSSRLGEELVVLNLKSGIYYGLNSVGARVWELAQQNQTVGAISQRIADEFDVQDPRWRRDLDQLLRQMQSEGLLRVA